MGPRPGGRGELTAWVGLQIGNELQWGRAPEGAESRNRECDTEWLRELQWGRAPEGAERVKDVPLFADLLVASMGPRPGGRGEIQKMI